MSNVRWYCITLFRSLTVGCDESMVHRHQDSRLLLQVLKTEKEYSSALNGVLVSSQASLTALGAYASSQSPAYSQSILSVVAALNGVDEALRGYVTAVDTWRADLKRVKRCEDEVANVMKDREIL